MEINGAQAAYRLLDVLTEVALNPEGCSATDVAQSVGLTAPTAHRLLRVLCDRHFLVQPTPGGPYRVGPQLRLIAGDGTDTARLAAVARPMIARLRDETDETVFLSVREGLHLTYLDVMVSTHSVQMYGTPGTRVPLHATSQGKVILAWAEDAVRQRLIDQLEFERFTPGTIGNAEALRAEVERARMQGYAVNLEEREIGVRSVAAPVLNREGVAIASVCVGGPIFRVSEEDLHGRLAELARATAASITSTFDEGAATSVPLKLGAGGAR